MLECVVNVSEGRDEARLGRLAAAAGRDLLDLHRDPHHHRSVFTLVGAAGPRRLAAAAVAEIDLRAHEGVHPRFGAVDVVPFVPLAGSTLDDAVAARNDFAVWAAETLDLPCYLYGPARTLPEVRRDIRAGLAPDVGPATLHPTAGAAAVGARGLLVAYNLWLVEADLATARRVAAAVRGDGIRALGLPVADRVQVSMNLIDPVRVGPLDAWERVAALAEVAGAEVVGLVPDAVVAATPERHRARLDLDPDRTIEARLARRGA